MALSKIVSCIRESRFCVVENVIPPSELPEIRRQLVVAQQLHNEESEAELAKTHAKGIRVGTQGVGLLKQMVNATRCFTPYLADDRILRAAESFFGDFVRISYTDCVINRPGCQRGYWPAD